MINKDAKNKIFPSYNLLLIIAFLAGFVSLAYEIIATKVLYYFFNESTITASSVISIFLFGIGLGSFIFSKFEKKISDKKKFLLTAQLLIALYAVFVFPNYDLVPYFFNHLYRLFGNSVTMMLINKLIISFLYLIFPTILMGMVFPAIIVMSIDKIEQLPEKIGIIYGFDLFGAVFRGNSKRIFFHPISRYKNFNILFRIDKPFYRSACFFSEKQNFYFNDILFFNNVMFIIFNHKPF